MLTSAYTGQKPSLFQVKLSVSVVVLYQGFPVWRLVPTGMDTGWLRHPFFIDDNLYDKSCCPAFTGQLCAYGTCPGDGTQQHPGVPLALGLSAPHSTSVFPCRMHPPFTVSYELEGVLVRNQCRRKSGFCGLRGCTSEYDSVAWWL